MKEETMFVIDQTVDNLTHNMVVLEMNKRNEIFEKCEKIKANIYKTIEEMFKIVDSLEGNKVTQDEFNTRNVNLYNKLYSSISKFPDDILASMYLHVKDKYDKLIF